MNTIEYISNLVIPAAFALLPEKMRSVPARAMLLATGLQESRFKHRRQMGAGPARGFWQFERMGGVRGVLMHPASKEHIESVLSAIRYDNTTGTSYEAIEHNDVLACVYARLLLWTSPRGLPISSDANGAWTMYLEDCWRPGKPHRKTWDAFYSQAWEMA